MKSVLDYLEKTIHKRTDSGLDIYNIYKMCAEEQRLARGKREQNRNFHHVFERNGDIEHREEYQLVMLMAQRGCEEAKTMLRERYGLTKWERPLNEGKLL